ncbi:TetR/AcrR family transcriptional regulator [Mucilaginibacter sp.]|jgi:TetR/AcrR family transcriptional repressor of nem operon|uniref:TetR/AcrR family transcriptional regulator n=1 Tax=Mucilaginibacter sp. TaxID=1882438 RepID=UPI003569C7BC
MARPQIFNQDTVIDKALDVFWQKGFGGASTKDLINAAGISNGSFFNSFGDKKALYLKCLQKYDTVYITALENLLIAPLKFKEKIKNVLLEATKKSPGKDTYEGCFFFNTSIDSSVDDAGILGLADAIHQRIEKAFVSAVDMAKEAGEISKDIDSTRLAQYLFNIVNGLRALLLNSPPQSTINNIINTTLDLLPS